MSSEQLLDKLTQKYQNAYRKRTLKSREAFESARKYMPGGDTRTSIFFWPYPIWIEKAEGYQITDVDGNEYIDFHNCYTTLVLGHANPRVMAAVREQLLKGTAHGALMPIVIRWAELICQRVESVEKIRFSNSGTEAVMMAIRVARAFTGKDKILKIEEGYSGSYDPVIYPSDAIGLPKSVLTDSLAVPYNDEEAAERAIVENKEELAAVIVEGVMGAAGMIPPEDDYLKFLQQVTTENNVLLILDEVISFRIATGGAQQIYDVKPDLTVLGKSIAGGLPAAAFGGREDIMAVFSPKQKRPVRHGGTFIATPATAAAGIAGLREMTKEALDRIKALGESLAEDVRRVLADLKIKAQVAGYGSLHQIHFTPEPVTNAAVSANQDMDIKQLFHLAMLIRGMFTQKRVQYNVSMPMTQTEINEAVAATADGLSELKPLIKEVAPQLIG